MRGPLRERIDRELSRRRFEGLLRSIPEPPPARRLIDLSTNSYLALHANEEVAREARRAADGSLHGNLASRLVADTSPLCARLEDEIAAWKRCEAALLFNSGYAANTGILQALCTRDTEVFCDRLNHASIVDGARLSGCRLTRYRHTDMADLRARLRASKAKEKLIVTDSVFSMDGDTAPLADMCELAAAHSCALMVDEAHAAGLWGESGSGLVEALGLAGAVDIRMGTLSKSVAGFGAFVAGEKRLREYCVNFSRSLIYSTGLPHGVIAFDYAAVRFIRDHPGYGAEVLQRADSLRGRLRALGFDTGGSVTQIVPCIVRDAAAAMELSAFLRGKDILAPAVRPPTVPANSARVRFSVHRGFTHDDEEALIAALAEWKSRHG